MTQLRRVSRSWKITFISVCLASLFGVLVQVQPTHGSQAIWREINSNVKAQIDALKSQTQAQDQIKIIGNPNAECFVEVIETKRIAGTCKRMTSQMEGVPSTLFSNCEAFEPGRESVKYARISKQCSNN